MEQVKNRKPGTWGAGTSGNPGGRPKGIERLLRDEIDRCSHLMRKADGSDNEEAVEGFRALARRLWQIAMIGENKDSLVAIKVIYERVYGAPRQTVELTTEQPAARIDWSAVPEEKRRAMLAAHEEMRQLATVVEMEDGGAVEH